MVKIDIRWSDIDANRHVGNSAFMNYMSHARLQYMKAAGIGQKVLEKYHLGPVAFYENISYFREINGDEEIYVSVELKGLSEDYTFFEFMHNIYNRQGEHKASCRMMGAWIDMHKRCLTPLPEELRDGFQFFEKTSDFKVLTKEDTRLNGAKPHNLTEEEFDLKMDRSFVQRKKTETLK